MGAVLRLSFAGARLRAPCDRSPLPGPGAMACARKPCGPNAAGAVAASAAPFSGPAASGPLVAAHCRQAGGSGQYRSGAKPVEDLSEKPASGVRDRFRRLRPSPRPPSARVEMRAPALRFGKAGAPDGICSDDATEPPSVPPRRQSRKHSASQDLLSHAPTSHSHDMDQIASALGRLTQRLTPRALPGPGRPVPRSRPAPARRFPAGRRTCPSWPRPCPGSASRAGPRP